MISRRDFVQGWVALMLSSHCSCFAQDEGGEIYGCSLPDDKAEELFGRSTESRLFISGQEPMIPKSGNANFDRALAQTLSKMGRTLGVHPGFAYYDDYDGENAYATSNVRSYGSDGTVLFGSGLLQTLMSNPDNPDLRVAAVCAHEFAHIFQYKHGLDGPLRSGQPTVKLVELQADFIAGYFAGVRKLERPSFPAAVFAQTQHAFGDTDFGSPGHHGTPEQRAAAIVRGFEMAYEEKKSLDQAVGDSDSFVRSL